MDLKDKNVLILGLGISGVSTVKALNKLGAKIYITDSKSEEKLKKYLEEIKDIEVELYLGTNDISLENIDLIIKSPGVPLDVDIIKKANTKGIEIITDIELAYRIRPNANFIAITGTNGKTTTTTLTGEYFKKSGTNTYVAGNIGVGILWDLVNSKEEDVFVIETSSFQLESTKDFSPKISLILNITPDHLNWHGSLENYIDSKKKIFKNQGKDKYTILNYDDLKLREMESEISSNIVWFSVNSNLSEGVCIENGYIVIKDNGKTQKIIAIDEIILPGKHNLENVLGSIAIAWLMGLEFEIIREVLKSFPGVEHRIEYVDTINGIHFYNDSKGTNSDASIRAIDALRSPIILIAGGMDKGTEFDDLILSFKDKVKALVLLGETKDKIKNTAIKYGFENVFLVENMKEAVTISYKLGEVDDNILLSPACASWDMYPSFEKRGDEFKSLVFNLGEGNNG